MLVEVKNILYRNGLVNYRIAGILGAFLSSLYLSKALYLRYMEFYLVYTNSICLFFTFIIRRKLDGLL